MRVASAEAREQRRQQTEEGIDGIAAKCAEQQVEPNHVRLLPAQHFQQSKNAQRIIEGPASFDGEALQFRFAGRDLVGQDRKGKERIAT